MSYADELRAKTVELLGKPWPTPETWEIWTHEERSKFMGCHDAANWLLDYSFAVRTFAEKTGLSLEASATIYFGMKLEHFLSKLTPMQIPSKEPWQE